MTSAPLEAGATKRPLVVETRAQLAEALKPTRSHGGRVAFVPTMGALHEGHVALLREAAARVGPSDVLVVSVFVNPLQFGPGEDYTRYPRTFEADLGVCAREGVDVVFAPALEEVYPQGEPQVTVDPGPLGDELEGASRPGHFRGVLTVVAKLFGLVRPDVAVFGEKDYQQLVLVRRMVSDLCLEVDVVGAPTVREPSGLALSSRNRYLDEEQTRAALALSRALVAGGAAAVGGPERALTAARAVLDAEVERGRAGFAPDYLALRSPELGEAPEEGEARILVAARIGNTRLIDNTAVTLGSARLSETITQESD